MCDARLVPSQDAFHRQVSPERRTRPHPDLAFRPEWRSPSLFARDPCRGLDGLGDRPRFSRRRASSVRARLPASAAFHDPRPLPRIPVGPRHRSMVEAKRVSEETARAGRRHTRLRAFAPQSPAHRPPEHPSSPAPRDLGMGNIAEIDPPGSRSLSPCRPPRRGRHIERPGVFPHRPSGTGAP